VATPFLIAVFMLTAGTALGLNVRGAAVRQLERILRAAPRTRANCLQGREGLLLLQIRITGAVFAIVGALIIWRLFA
jgi:hypothetical protein